MPKKKDPSIPSEDPIPLEINERVALLRGEELPPPPDPDDPSHLVTQARHTLAEVMGSHDAKPSDRLAAADSVLDRYAEPRKKFELGGSRTVNFQLSPEAMTKALSSLSTLFSKESHDVPSLPSPGPLPLPNDSQGSDSR